MIEEQDAPRPTRRKALARRGDKGEIFGVCEIAKSARILVIAEMSDMCHISLLKLEASHSQA
jgi:hypothetical protein